ncbi:MAG: copper amine oxidase N-terminal domain-containing protein, partial [Clostridia bacterium]|nr:copper amine oxidase N-terminal domain-containing protein [Clostridia bacterium]
MHLNIKKITAGIVILAIIIFALSYGAFATQNIKILIDGQELSYSKTAVIENEVPLVPMRKIFEALGAEVLWDGENRSVTAIYNSDVITVFPDDGSIIKNGELIDTQIKPAIIDNSVVVPVHIISQCFGKNVLWNGRDCT